MTTAKENGIGKNRSQVFTLKEAQYALYVSLKTKTNPGILFTLKENTDCSHVHLLSPTGILGGLADTFFLMFSRYLFV